MDRLKKPFGDKREWTLRDSDRKNLRQETSGTPPPLLLSTFDASSSTHYLMMTRLSLFTSSFHLKSSLLRSDGKRNRLLRQCICITLYIRPELRDHRDVTAFIKRKDAEVRSSSNRLFSSLETHMIIRKNLQMDLDAN